MQFEQHLRSAMQPRPKIANAGSPDEIRGEMQDG